MSPQNLAPGFLSIDDAVALIKSDTRSNPVVDMDWMIARIKWIETGHNFRIPKIKRLEKPFRNKYGRIIEFENVGDANVTITTNFEKELLKKTLLDKFRELTGHEYAIKNVRGVSTVADDAEGTNAVKPRPNKPNAKEGDSIANGGAVIDSNGEGILS